MEAAEVMSNEKSMALLGAIGPDIFFWGPDFEIVNIIYPLYKNIEKIVDIYNSIVDPIKDVMREVGEPVHDLVETLAPNTLQLIETTIEEIRETSSLMTNAIGNGLLAGAVEGFNKIIDGVNFLSDQARIPELSHLLFQVFVPPMQHGKNEEDWYWFDMLHYRKTGEFAKELINLADTNDDKAKAFAYGYLSHIATDVTLHPYVNQIVGGPYRLHVQRHVTVENWIDSMIYHTHYDESINSTLFEKLDLPEVLPSNIRDLLHQAFLNAYDHTDVVHPKIINGTGFYTKEDIEKTYEVFYKILSIMGKMGVERPEEPFSNVGDILSNALGAFEPPPAPPDTNSEMCDIIDIFSFGLTEDSRDCYDEFADNLGKWAEYLAKLVEWGLEQLRNLADLIATAMLSLPISALLALLYGLQLMCYNVYKLSHKILALHGFVYPEPEELDSSDGRSLTTPFQCQFSPFKYPHIHSMALNNLQCPRTELETPTTSPLPSPSRRTSNGFIQGQDIFNSNALRRYSEAEGPEDTRNLEMENVTIGNAVDFTRWLIENAVDEQIPDDIKDIIYTNWNLDSDRGYGYKAWSGTIPQEPPYDISDEDFI